MRPNLPYQIYISIPPAGTLTLCLLANVHVHVATNALTLGYATLIKNEKERTKGAVTGNLPHNVSHDLMPRVPTYTKLTPNKPRFLGGPFNIHVGTPGYSKGLVARAIKRWVSTEAYHWPLEAHNYSGI